MTPIILILIGLGAGVAAGIFGIGGGIVIVPALTYFLGFSQHRAIGTSLVILLPPVGLAAVMEYYRNGNVDVPAAIIVATTLFLGAWFGAGLAHKVSGPMLRIAFGIFVVLVGGYTAFSGYRSLKSEASAKDAQQSIDPLLS